MTKPTHLVLEVVNLSVKERKRNLDERLKSAIGKLEPGALKDPVGVGAAILELVKLQGNCTKYQSNKFKSLELAVERLYIPSLATGPGHTNYAKEMTG